MSSGTSVIQDALSHLGAHSVVSPAPPENIQIGYNVLNSMRAEWEDQNIDTGMVPLKEPGAELSEPQGIRNAVVTNLAIKLAPYFEEAKISPILRSEAIKGFEEVKRRWKVIAIPKQQVRETLPKGQGNRHSNVGSNTYEDGFFDAGDELG